MQGHGALRRMGAATEIPGMWLYVYLCSFMCIMLMYVHYVALCILCCMYIM